MKERFDQHDPKRFSKDIDKTYQRLQNMDYVARIHFNGLFWHICEWLEMESLCILMVDDPGWVSEMADF